MKITSTLLCFVAFVGQAAAADIDVSGYGAARWGMTPEQVLHSEKRTVMLDPPVHFSHWEGRAQIPSIEIDGQKFKADFLFDQSDKLAQVNISPADMSPIESKHEFFSLEKLLTEKYGAPTYHSGNTVTWRLVSNEVELHIMDVPGVATRLTVRYRPIQAVKNSTDNL
jgi:hypothetical protein